MPRMIVSLPVSPPSRITLLKIFSLSLLLRLAFCFFLSKYYYGGITFEFGDSYSYSQSFINLIKTGVYTFDFDYPDAYLYRPPVYPLFWGVHYLLFGAKYVYVAVAVTQSFLDAASSVLCLLLAARLGCSRRWSLFSGIIYSINPVLLVHVPITGTETLAIFLTLLSVYLTLRPSRYVHIFFAAFLVALATMVRQYLGIILPLILIYLFLCEYNSGSINLSVLFKKSAVFLLGFCLIVSPWFLRNTIELGKPTILMGETTGYAVYQEDYIAFRNFYNLYFVNITPIWNSIAFTGSDGISDYAEFGSLSKDMHLAAKLAHSCGSSFLAWKQLSSPLPLGSSTVNSCNKDVVSAYEKLRAKALDQGGLTLLIKSPLANLSKSLFKSDLVVGSSNALKGFAIKTVFTFRTFYVVLGLLSFVWLLRRPEAIFLLFPVLMICMISFGVRRQVEIRYLAQAEALLIPYAAASLSRLSELCKRCFKAF